MTTGHLSAADAALLTELQHRQVTVAGKPVSGNQLRVWRRHGLIDAPSTTSRGRRGRQSSYDVGIVEQVENVASWLTARRQLDEAVLVAFGLGRNPPEPRLRAAYHSYIDRQEAQATRVIDDEALLARVTRALFSQPVLAKFGSPLALDSDAKALRHQDPTSRETLTRAHVRQQLVGGISAAVAEGVDSVSALAADMGIDQHLAAHTRFSLQETQLLLDDQMHPSPEQLRDRIDTADYPGLIRTRDLVAALMHLIPAAPELFPFIDQRGHGLLVANMVAGSKGSPPAGQIEPGDLKELRNALPELLTSLGERDVP